MTDMVESSSNFIKVLNFSFQFYLFVHSNTAFRAANFCKNKICLSMNRVIPNKTFLKNIHLKNNLLQLSPNTYVCIWPDSLHQQSIQLFNVKPTFFNEFYVSVNIHYKYSKFVHLPTFTNNKTKIKSL